MSKRSFLATVLVVFVAFGAANVAMWIWSKRLQPSQALDNVEHVRNGNVLVLGNSLLQAAFESRAFEESARRESAKLVPVNAAIAGTLPAEHYLMFQQGIRNAGIHTVIVGFYDYQLSLPNAATVQELFGNRSVILDHRVPVRDGESIYEFSRVDRLRLRLFRALPVIAYRAAPWLYVELLRIRLGGPFFNMDGSIERQFQSMQNNLADGPAYFGLPMKKVVEECSARRYRVIFVLMPMSPWHRETFYAQPRWRTYLASLRNLFEEQRCGYIDASAWFLSQGDFSDSVHLDAWRRRDFSSRLAKVVISESTAMKLRHGWQ